MHFFAGELVFCQNISNSSSFYIPQGIALSTAGSIGNAGFLQNNGVIYFSGNWSNTGVYQGTGAITLEGGDQSINNNGQQFAAYINNYCYL